MPKNIEVILVDIGNTRIKTVERVKNSFRDRKYWDTIFDLHEKYHNHPLVISSVKDSYEDLKKVFSSKNHLILNHSIDLPIAIDYKNLNSLGTDRIALATGTYCLYPNNNNLIFSLGTCLTRDFVDKEGRYRGGGISPGLVLRMKSLNHFTQKLPDISENWNVIPLTLNGQSTEECILSGIFWGIIHEINQNISVYKKKYQDLNIIMTGGDSKYFESHIKANIFADSGILETGLYRIWKHQRNIL